MKYVFSLIAILFALNAYASTEEVQMPSSAVGYLILNASQADDHGIYTVEAIDRKGNHVTLKVTDDQIIDLGNGQYGISSNVHVWAI